MDVKREGKGRTIYMEGSPKVVQKEIQNLKRKKIEQDYRKSILIS